PSDTLSGAGYSALLSATRSIVRFYKEPHGSPPRREIDRHRRRIERRQQVVPEDNETVVRPTECGTLVTRRPCWPAPRAVVRPTECGPLVTRTRSARTFTLLSDPRNAALSSPDLPLDQRREALSDPRNAALSSPEPSCLGEIVKLSDPRNAALSSPEQALEALRTLLSDPRNAALSSPQALFLE